MFRGLLFLASLTGQVTAEDGLAAWLRYAPIPDAASLADAIPSIVVCLNSTKSSPVYTAGVELAQGIKGIVGKDVQVSSQLREQNGPAITVGTLDGFRQAGGRLPAAPDLTGDGFWLDTRGGGVLILGRNERGALYGAFEYLSMLARGGAAEVACASSPAAPIRWVNQWDNLDGSIERGYGGPSLFFAGGVVRDDLARAAGYARLLASVGINGVVINNVNADRNMLNATNVAGLGRVAEAMRPYGVRVGISLNFASPNATLGTFDPLDAAVVRWWTDIIDAIYETVPDLAGFLVKGDSEGQPGPMSYNRTLADGANLFARAVSRHGGIVMYRAFVYDDKLDESDWRADRAKAAVDYFAPLDGLFEDNVVVQIKYGPIDFQVREPASPLFARLRETNVAVELQVAQEYLGQQCHLAYLAPLWETVLGFDLRVDDRTSLVRDVASGRRFGRALGGAAAVVNAGAGPTWLGSHLAAANLYAYGRLAWDPARGARPPLEDWARLTFSADAAVVAAVAGMQMLSWPAYENYTGNLGIQTLTNILGNHYGPKPQSQDGNGYGQWTRAGPEAVGMDRTLSNGTGFAAQYPPQVFERYEDVDATPDDLLLWFHHVPWTRPLRSGVSVIQHFYDAHYAGAETAQTLVAMWEGLRGRPGIDDQRFDEVLYRQTYQAGHALVWRDAIVNFYHNLTGLPDARGRVGNHPHRVEAEAMDLGAEYQVISVSPTEAASGGGAVMTRTNATAGVATAAPALLPPAGVYDLAVNYFDVAGGRARWEAFVGGRLVGAWRGDMEDRLGHAPTALPDESSAARVTFRGVRLGEGDDLRVVGTPDGIEAAFLDYVSFLPPGVVD